MPDKTTEAQETLLKVEFCFDQDAAATLDEMKKKANVKNTEQLVFNALRVYDWYLREGLSHPLYQRRGDQWVQIKLEV